MAGEAREPDFLTRHFGTVVTALVTLAGLGFGAYQFTAQDRRAEEDSRRAEQESKLGLSRFVIEHYAQLFDESDPLRRARMRAVMETTFPPELVARFNDAQIGQVTAILPQAQTAEVVRRAAEGIADLKADAPATPALPVTTFLHIAAEGDREVARRLQEALDAAGFRTPGIERVAAAPRRGDVRYFHPEDEARAVEALALMRDVLPAGAPVLDAPVNLGGKYPNVPRGVIEVWLPPLGG